MRITKTRESVWDYLSKHEDAFTPYELAKILKLNPVTVYRVLEFLVGQKFVHHLPSIGKWYACHFHDKTREDHGFLICEKCQNIKEFVTPRQHLHHQGFKCYDCRIEITGICAGCSHTS